MQLKDIFSASSDGVSQPSNSTLRFKQKALAASILAALAIIAFIAVEASDTKPARKAPTEAAMITLRPDGTDKDVLIARYDANFLALSRRIEEVQREAAATETRLRAIIADQKSRLAKSRTSRRSQDARALRPVRAKRPRRPRPASRACSRQTTMRPTSRSSPPSSARRLPERSFTPIPPETRTSPPLQSSPRFPTSRAA